MSYLAPHKWYTYLAASLEPLAYEGIQSGTFSYAIGSTTKLLMSAWGCRVGGSGRLDVRDVTRFLPLRNMTLTGTLTGPPPSIAALIDPSLATYTDARSTYYDRLLALADLASGDLKSIGITAPSVTHALPPGPYGNIILHTTTFDLAWIGPTFDGGISAFPITNEIGDTGSTDYQRITNNVPFAVSKNMMGGILTGQERTGGAGKGQILYYICPSTWGKVVDPISYIFRDDFMGATLDTGSTWTRAQSTAGFVEINTDFAWCKLQSDTNTWGQNGARSQATTARSAGKVFVCDVFTGAAHNNNFPGIVGWNDNGGLSYTNFSHGLNFTQNGSQVTSLQIFENSNNRGTVGSGWSFATIYRVRITLTGNAATYEIQGGSQYGKIGSNTWTTLTPGVSSSSSTTPLSAGFSTAAIASGFNVLVGDVKLL